MRCLLSLSLLFLILPACRNKPANGNGAPQPVDFSIQHFEQQQGCENDTVSCVRFVVDYPQAVRGDESVRYALNQRIEQWLLMTIARDWLPDEDTAHHPLTLTQAANDFFDYFSETAEEDADAERPYWSLEVKGKLLFHSTKVISIQFDTYSNTGGAHPNLFSTILNLDAITGQVLDGSAFIADPGALLRLVEQRFRQEKNLPAGADLEQEGYFLKDGRFFLPDNIGITTEGLLFLYNDYEIAAHAAGATAYVIPFETLGRSVYRDRLLDKTPQ